MRVWRVAHACAAVALLGMTNLVAQAPEPRAGKRAPEIDFKTFDGLRVKLSELRGWPVVVTFWASYCPPCRQEFPALEAAWLRHGPAGLVVLAVNQTTQERRESDVRRFLAEVPVSFPVLLDKTGSSYRAWRFIGLPTTAFIDSAGVIRSMKWGALSEGELDRGIATILTVPAEKVPPG